MEEGDGEVSRSMVHLDCKTYIQMYEARILYEHKGWWILIMKQDFLRAIQLQDPTKLFQLLNIAINTPG